MITLQYITIVDSYAENIGFCAILEVCKVLSPCKHKSAQRLIQPDISTWNVLDEYRSLYD